MRVFNDSDTFGPAPGPPAPPGVNDYVKNRIDRPPSLAPGPFDVLANMPLGLFFLDPPVHGTVRGLIEPSFRQAIARGQRRRGHRGSPGTRGGKAERHDRALYVGTPLPMPAAVLMTVLGIPSQDWMGIGQWIGANLAGHDITQPAAVQAMGATCFMAINAYLQALTSGNGPVPPTPGGLLRSAREERGRTGQAVDRAGTQRGLGI